MRPHLVETSWRPKKTVQWGRTRWIMATLLLGCWGPRARSLVEPGGTAQFYTDPICSMTQNGLLFFSPQAEGIYVGSGVPICSGSLCQFLKLKVCSQFWTGLPACPSHSRPVMPESWQELLQQLLSLLPALADGPVSVPPPHPAYAPHSINT